MTFKENSKKVIKYLFYIITAVQAVLGIIWIAGNFTHVYMWPETVEYLDIAHNGYVLDEYVGIIYPLLVKCLYYAPLYALQLILAAASTYLFLNGSLKTNKADSVWGSVYILTFPLLLQFHLSVRPESLRLSAALFAITFLTYKKRSVKRYAIMAVALILLFTVTKSLQTPGVRGRIQKTFWSAAFMRTCTEYYSKSYAIMDERTQDTFDIWESMEIAKKSDNIMYVIGPAMDSKWGFVSANESYKYDTMANLRIRTRDICELIGADLLEAGTLPFSILAETGGDHKNQTGRNYEAFTSTGLRTDSFYWAYGLWGLVLVLILGIINTIVLGKNQVKAIRQSLVWELIVAAVLQWLYKTMTTGDAVDYSKYLVLILAWCVLATHLILGKKGQM